MNCDGKSEETLLKLILQGEKGEKEVWAEGMA